MQKKDGVIKGLLWHQGESDTVTEELAKLYETKLLELMKDVRQDVGNSNLPVVVGNMLEAYGTSPKHDATQRVKQINRVRKALSDVAATPNVGFVETAGCTSIDKHNVNFDRRSYIVLGQRYFDLFSTLQTN